MDEHTRLAQRFEDERPHLRAVAYRLLGRIDEVDDAVQESWLRLSGSNSDNIVNLGAWLMTVVARVCLDMLRVRHARREESLEALVPQVVTDGEGEIDPEQEMELADAVGLTLLVVLDTLAPAERLAFVLHDIFAVPFDVIAPIVERSDAATRQLASRARRRVRGRGRASMQEDADLAVSRGVVEAFLAAAREGSFDALLAVLDPDVVVRIDSRAVFADVPEEGLHGAALVAKLLVEHDHIFRACRAVLVDGSVGIVVAPYGRLLAVGDFLVRGGKIGAISAITDPARVRRLHLAVLDD
jgi:RNA polymerase sigma factor (sigma-70 family)